MALLTYLHGGAVTSFAKVDLPGFKAWMAEAPRSRADTAGIFAYLVNDNLARDADEVKQDFLTTTSATAARYFTASLGPALDVTAESFVFANCLARHMLNLKREDSVTSLGNYTRLQLRNMSGVRKSQLGALAAGAINNAESDFIDCWFRNHKLAGLAKPAILVTDGDAQRPPRGGIGCNVYSVTVGVATKVGAFKEAAAGSSRPNHAERKWLEDYGDTDFAAADRIDFHISAAPCGEQCAGMLIDWIAGLNRNDLDSYVFTYGDYDGNAYVYKLTGDAMLRIDTWTP